MISNKEGQSWIMAKNLKKMTSKGNDNLVDEISEDFASLGFYRGAIDTGNWRAVINVHAIITNDVTYHLKIEGEE